MDLAWEYSVHRAGWESYLAARNSAQSAGFPEDVLESDKPDDPDWEWDRLNWRYDPIPALEKVRCPVLALFGGADRNVVPEDNLPPMRRALKKAGNRDVTLLVVPGANHGLVTVSPESVPLHRLTGIGDQGWPQVQRWLAAHLSLDGAR